MIIELAMAIAMQSTQAGGADLASAARAWAACAEQAAVFTARTDETAEVANDLAVTLCVDDHSAVSEALSRQHSDARMIAEEEALYRRIAGARSLVRIVFERACPAGDVECEAFFRERLGMVR